MVCHVCAKNKVLHALLFVLNEWPSLAWQVPGLQAVTGFILRKRARFIKLYFLILFHFRRDLRFKIYENYSTVILKSAISHWKSLTTNNEFWLNIVIINILNADLLEWKVKEKWKPLNLCLLFFQYRVRIYSFSFHSFITTDIYERNPG